LVDDWKSFWEFRRLENPPRRLREPGVTVNVRFRQLAGVPVKLRPHTEDDGLARDVFFPSYHLPPPPTNATAVSVIWDLGANVGLTMAHMATLFPQARIVGVELDEHNAALCRENIAPWSNRSEVIHAGVWAIDGTVGYERPSGRAQSFHVVKDAASAMLPEAPAISLSALLERTGGGLVDYVKMDIEGAERLVLNENTAWAANVLAIKVELHDGYTMPECIKDLERLGFAATRIPRHKAGVVGIRPPAERERLLHVHNDRKRRCLPDATST
jgi:FkbM family methyltransferase